MAHFDDDPSPQTLPNLFLERARHNADRVAYRARVDGEWRPTLWRDARQRVRDWSMGLLAVGVEAGTAVAIMSSTRPEWAEIDMANLCLGAVTVGLYPNLPRREVRQLLELSGARFVIVEDRAKRLLVQEVSEALDSPVTIITMEADEDVQGVPALSLNGLARLGAERAGAAPDEFERRIGERKVDEVVSYIYTAGTTDEPKGAMLTHRNFHYVIGATNALVPYEDEEALVCLPMANSLQRFANYLNLMVGVELHYGGSLNRLDSDLVEVQPTCFVVVPRLLNKLERRVIARGEGSVKVQQAGFRRAIAAMHAAASRLRGGFEPGVRGRLRARLADRVVGRRIREMLGGRIKFIGTGGGPLSRETHAFFEDVGVPVLVGYGATETCAPACLNTLDNRRIGTVGRPLPGTEVRIDEDGEILIRGPGVFQGYFRNQSATSAAFTDDGWFKTGDVGFMSRDGFLTLNGRKADVIVTSTGDSVAPQPLELALARHPWVDQAVVVGDGRPYLGALLSLDPDVLPSLAAEVGLAPTADPAEVAEHPLVKKVFEDHLAQLNAEQPVARRVERFSVLADNLTTASGELTPTYKVRRRVVNERRGSAIERLYRP